MVGKFDNEPDGLLVLDETLELAGDDDPVREITSRGTGAMRRSVDDDSDSLTRPVIARSLSARARTAAPKRVTPEDENSVAADPLRAYLKKLLPFLKI